MVKVFRFLEGLQNNNNRNWFEANRSEYESCQNTVISLAERLLEEIRKHDLIETASGKKSLHRIYRDVRFSKDKTPYKSNWSGGFRRATAQRRGGYYFHLEPGKSYLAGGFWGPNKEDLKLIREHLEVESDDYRQITDSADFKRTFGSVLGDQLKKSPKGFDPESTNIDLLRFQQFVLKHELSDDKIFSPNFPSKASEIFQKMRPYFDLMSNFLTTDLNGIEINSGV